MRSQNTTKRHLPLLVGGGLAVGLLGGLLGAGGGIVAVFVLGKVLKDTEADGKDVFANTVAIVIPLCIFSLVGTFAWDIVYFLPSPAYLSEPIL